MFRWSTAGESHGRSLVALVEGVPAGLELTSADIANALERRRRGYGRGARQKFEQDALTVLSGIRHGRTIGSPIALEIGNSEWPKWETVMSPDPVDPAALTVDAGTGDEREIARNRPLTRPRPGHADLVGMNKYGFTEARPVLERASARETAARVAAGAVAAALCGQVAGITILSHVLSLGSAADTSGVLPGPSDSQRLDESPVRCLDPAVQQAMTAEVDAAKKAGETLGGTVQVVIYGLPQGLGSYTTPFARLDARLAGAMMSIQSVKGVAIGDGFESARRLGSQAHDEIVREDGHVRRLTNRAGGIEGGMSNGEPIRVSVAFKPISTVPRALRTIDTLTGEPTTAIHQRSDTTAVVPGAVVAEAMAALVIAESLCEKFGGDSVEQMRGALAAYIDSIPEVRK
ncbi:MULTISPECIES: chorismate synthase [unclassified Actinobaculum]|uniref:chorismate synthase n=1 Tax=unclassified Actinobaculum TaxID=2609299 RepID=UPI000D525CDD|nr:MULTISPECIES: chorismate synthase [unclassified Actinobaculum]AWE42370.1 chorismate synthase [Actinobaculum sp. 313]RTE50950.1 chorismate synthase [Actinobaculum sp. 352]